MFADFIRRDWRLRRPFVVRPKSRRAVGTWFYLLKDWVFEMPSG